MQPFEIYEESQALQSNGCDRDKTQELSWEVQQQQQQKQEAHGPHRSPE